MQLLSPLSDFLTQGSAPWWGVPIGVLGGAAIALVSTWRSDKRRDTLERDRDHQRELHERARDETQLSFERERGRNNDNREDQQRWHDRIRVVSASLISTTWAINKYATEYRTQQTLHDAAHPDPYRRPAKNDAEGFVERLSRTRNRISEMEEANTKMQELIGIKAELDIIAPKSIRDAGNPLANIAREIVHSTDSMILARLNTNLAKRTEQFLKAVQEFLVVDRALEQTDKGLKAESNKVQAMPDVRTGTTSPERKAQ